MPNRQQRIALVVGALALVAAFVFQPKIFHDPDFGPMMRGYRAVWDKNQMVSDIGLMALEIVGIVLLTGIGYLLGGKATDAEQVLTSDVFRRGA